MNIVADTSAFVAIYREEVHAEACRFAIASTNRILVPSSVRVEAALLQRPGPDFFDWFCKFVDTPAFENAALTYEVIGRAVEAARCYGKGSGHPAKLNFGDCLVYGVAIERKLPLLFVGEDFRHTSIEPVL